ncbi:MAG: JAB domain-containing protein [Nevskiales bacterium]
MFTGIRDGNLAAHLDHRPYSTVREPRGRYGRPFIPGHVLAGSDLSVLWDPARFVRDGIPYGCAFMKRMHHPFHEVLACLYLNAEHAAIAYNSYFRGEKTSALANLPTVQHSARQLGAARVLLAHNPIWDADSSLPDLSLVSRQMQAVGVELHDFLLISSGNTLSMRAHGVL